MPRIKEKKQTNRTKREITNGCKTKGKKENKATRRHNNIQISQTHTTGDIITNTKSTERNRIKPIYISQPDQITETTNRQRENKKKQEKKQNRIKRETETKKNNKQEDKERRKPRTKEKRKEKSTSKKRKRKRKETAKRQRCNESSQLILKTQRAVEKTRERVQDNKPNG